MSARIDSCLLWARAGVVGTVAFLLGVVGHVSAAGLLPGVGVLLVLLLMAVVMSAPALVREASGWRLAALLVGGQTLIHLALTTTAGHVGDAPAASVSRPRGAVGGELPVVDGRRTGSLLDAYQGGVPEAASGSGHPVLTHLVGDMAAHAPMMLAHVAAALLVAAWLAHGERLVWALLRLTGRLVVRCVLPRTAPALRTPVLSSWLTGHTRLLGHPAPILQPLLRRGPPLATV